MARSSAEAVFNTTLSGTTASSTRFWYDDNQNRVKMIDKAGGVSYFVYDPTASIPADTVLSLATLWERLYSQP